MDLFLLYSCKNINFTVTILFSEMLADDFLIKDEDQNYSALNAMLDSIKEESQKRYVVFRNISYNKEDGNKCLLSIAIEL